MNKTKLAFFFHTVRFNSLILSNFPQSFAFGHLSEGVVVKGLPFKH
ncbi:hypothetical protein SAMN05192534_11367 [Alteribacillus persepolensis]|uniref:Uncharacterized protein n=1 Tax=Alteribacillus persepolensis TaxID=568899 RepID=A0A1G8FXI7_9BACI|nr:hypothetical protein [Alteribacillus persepolensis]SDH86795.1 hypothetical protein SAMN05192534_11367 [Alteribacillus persepolensis]